MSFFSRGTDRSPRSRNVVGSTTNLTLSGHGSQPQSHSRSERDLTKVTKVRVRTGSKEESNSNKQRAKMKTTTMIVNDGGSSSVTSGEFAGPTTVDVVRAPLNWQLAESTAQALQVASDNLVQLYKRISLDYELEESQRIEFLQRLASSAGVSQQTLRPVNPGYSGGSQGVQVSLDQGQQPQGQGQASVSPQHKR